MNPLLHSDQTRVWTRFVLIATIGSLLASMLALSASVVAAPQAGAQTSTDPSVAKLIQCEKGGATVSVFLDNRGNPIQRYNLTVDWKTVPGYAPADRITENKYFGVHDGEFDVSYTFGREVRKTRLTVNCKDQLGMASVQINTGCQRAAGYATFYLKNPTSRSVTFDVKGYGTNPVKGNETAAESIVVPARQDRTINFLNLSDAGYLLDVRSSDGPTSSFFSPLDPSNTRKTVLVQCNLNNPSLRESERNHVVSTTCDGTRAVVNVAAERETKAITVVVGNYDYVIRSATPTQYGKKTLLSGIKSGVYDIYVRVGSTGETFKKLPVDCDGNSYLGNGGTVTPTATPNPTATPRPTSQPTPTPTGNARAEIKNSCLAENGRIDAFVYNETGSTKTFYLKLAPLGPRSVTVPAGGQNRMTITGRRDQQYTATVTDNTGAVLANSTFDVACDAPLAPARVKTSCLAGNGRVDVFVGNTTNRSQTYEVRVGTIVRSQNAPAGETRRVTVTGRPDGLLGVTVLQAGSQIHSETVRIGCN